MLAYIDVEGPPGDGADLNQDMNEGGYEDGRGVGTGSPAPIKADLISSPTEGGGFKACDYVGPEMAAFCNADPDVMVEPWLAELLACGVKSGARIEPSQGIRGGRQAAIVGQDGGAHSGESGASSWNVCGRGGGG